MSDEREADESEVLWDVGLSRAFQAREPDDVHSCGRFALVERIARGGIGTIHRAWDDRLERDVAIKRLRDEHVEDTAMIGRFLAEARVAARLQHPGVVPIYDSGIDDSNRPYLCMKLVEGRTMVDLLRDEPRDTARLLEVFRRLCETMAYAHDRGVVHRDLKPSNVMIGEFGEVLVVDWGFAKLMDDAVEDVASSDPAIRTRTEGSSSVAGSILGTPAYMPPEQARGEVAALDERVDVFALGAILCEVLTGEPPYTRESGKLALEHAARADLDAALARLEACGAEEALIEICWWCLRPDASERPRHAGVLEARVESWFADARADRERALVEAAEADVRVAEERKLRRVTTVLASAVLALVVGGAGFGWRELDRRRDVRIAAAREFHLAMREFETGLAARDWSAAEQSINLAIVHAERGHDRVGAARIRDARRRLADAHEVDAERARRERRAVAFRDALVEVRDSGMEAPPVRDRRLTTAFRDAGIDVDRRVAADAAAEIREMGLDTGEVVRLLDEWTAIRKVLATPGPEGRTHVQPDRSRRLSELADALDDDAERSRLRRAARTASPDEMARLVGDLDVAKHDAATLVMLAMALVGGQRGELAIALLEDAHRRFPGDYWINHHLSVMVGMRTSDGEEGHAPVDYDRALHHAWLAVAADPQSMFAREQVARILVAVGRTAEAMRTLDDASAIRPDRAAAIRRRLLRRAPLGDAIDVLRDRVERVPSDVGSRGDLASMLVLIGDFAAAEREAARCMESAEAPSGVVRARMKAFIELGRYEQALALAGAADVPDGDFLLADARRLLRQDTATPPHGRLETILRGRWLAHAGRLAEAARVFARVVSARTRRDGAPRRDRGPPPRDDQDRPPRPGFGPPEGGPLRSVAEAGFARRTMAAVLLQVAGRGGPDAARYAGLAVECLERDLRSAAHRGPEGARRLEAWIHDVRFPAIDTVEGIPAETRARWIEALGRISD